MTDRQFHVRDRVDAQSERAIFFIEKVDVMLDNRSPWVIASHSPRRWRVLPIPIDDKKTVDKFFCGTFNKFMKKMLDEYDEFGNPKYRLILGFNVRSVIKKSMKDLLSSQLKTANILYQHELELLEKNHEVVDEEKIVKQVRKEALNSQRVGTISIVTTAAFTFAKLEDMGLQMSLKVSCQNGTRIDDKGDFERNMHAKMIPIHYQYFKDQSKSFSIEHIVNTLRNKTETSAKLVRRSNCFLVYCTRDKDKMIVFPVHSRKDTLKITACAYFPQSRRYGGLMVVPYIHTVSTNIGNMFVLARRRKLVQTKALEYLEYALLNRKKITSSEAGSIDADVIGSDIEERKPIRCSFDMGEYIEMSTLEAVIEKLAIDVPEDFEYCEGMCDEGLTTSSSSASSSSTASSSSSSIMSSFMRLAEITKKAAGPTHFYDACSFTGLILVNARMLFDVFWRIRMEYTRCSLRRLLDSIYEMGTKAHTAAHMIYYERGRSEIVKPEVSLMDRWAVLYVFNYWF